MEIKQIKETCIYVKDLDQTQNFYHNLLGLPVIGRKEKRHVFFNAGTSVLLCFIAEATRQETELPPHWATGPAHLAFEVSASQYDSWKQKVSSTEIEIIHEHSWGGGFHSFYFYDPDQHVLEIVPEGMWEYLGAGD